MVKRHISHTGYNGCLSLFPCFVLSCTLLQCPLPETLHFSPKELFWRLCRGSYSGYSISLTYFATQCQHLCRLELPRWVFFFFRATRCDSHFLSRLCRDLTSCCIQCISLAHGQQLVCPTEGAYLSVPSQRQPSMASSSRTCTDFHQSQSPQCEPAESEAMMPFSCILKCQVFWGAFQLGKPVGSR